MFIPLQTIVLDNSGNAAVAVTPQSIAAILAANGIDHASGHNPQIQVTAFGTDFTMKTGADVNAAMPVNTVTSALRPKRTTVVRNGAIMMYGLRDDDNFVSVIALDATTLGTVEVVVGHGEKT